MSQMYLQYAKKTAKKREDVHKDHQSSRPLSKDYEAVGMAGEFAFAEFSNLWPDVTVRPSGDKNIDFKVALVFTVDVKTARIANYLIHEANKPFADIFVLAEYNDKTEQAELIGWEWGTVLKAAPTKDFGYNITSHYISKTNLRTMSSLKAKLHNIK